MAFALGFCFAFLGACKLSPGTQLTPVEQLPNPETGKEKTQIYLLLDEDSLFWNAPNTSQINSELRVRTHIFSSRDPQELETELRVFNARANDILILVSERLEGPARASGVYTHPSRALTLNLSPKVAKEVRWDLSKLFSLVQEFCLSPKLSCSWDPKLLQHLEKVGLPPPPKLVANPQGSKLRVGFKADDSENPPSNQLLLSMDWLFWMEQVLRYLRNPEAAQSSAPWKKLSLQNGNLRLKLQSFSEPLIQERAEHEERLKQLRMKYLQ
jgi:hypothetical protein